MTLNKEADLLRYCIFSKQTKYPFEITYSNWDIQDCLSQHDIDPVHFENLKDCFSVVTEKRLCREHQRPVEDCGCSEDKLETYVEYQLQPNALLSWWADRVNGTNIFQTGISIEEDEGDSYLATTSYNGVNIELAIFLSATELYQYSLSPETLEFGIAFLPPVYGLEEEDVFLWYEPLDKGFREDFRNKLNDYQYAIPAPFADISSDEGYRRPIRRSFEQFLEENGFDTRRGVDGDAGVARDYRISISKISLVGINSEEIVLLCDCERHDMWHWHRFNGDRVVGVEDNPVMAHMLDEMDENIDEYQKLVSYQKTVKGLSTALSGVAIVISIATLLTNYETASNFINNIMPINIGGGPVAVGLLTFGTLVVTMASLIVISPFLRERFRFSWSIPNYKPPSN